MKNRINQKYAAVLCLCIILGAFLFGRIGQSKLKAGDLTKDDYLQLKEKCYSLLENEVLEKMERIWKNAGRMGKDDTFSIERDLTFVIGVYSFTNYAGNFCLALPFSITLNWGDNTDIVYNILYVENPSRVGGELVADAFTMCRDHSCLFIHFSDTNSRKANLESLISMEANGTVKVCKIKYQ